MEQLNLAFKPKQQRRYSTALLVMSYIMYSTSRKGYARLLEKQQNKKRSIAKNYKSYW